MNFPRYFICRVLINLSSFNQVRRVYNVYITLCDLTSSSTRSALDVSISLGLELHNPDPLRNDLGLEARPFMAGPLPFFLQTYNRSGLPFPFFLDRFDLLRKSPNLWFLENARSMLHHLNILISSFHNLNKAQREDQIILHVILFQKKKYM